MNWFDEHIDPKYVKVCLYSSVTILLTAAVGYLLYSSSPIFIKVWELITAVAEPFVYGMLFCYMLLPMVRRITNWLADHRIFQGDIVVRLHIAVAITVAILALLVLGIVALLTMVITRSIDSVNIETVQALLSNAEGDITTLFTTLISKAEEVGIIEGGGSTTMIGAFGEMSSIFSTIVFSIVFGIYFLLDGARVFEYGKRVFVATFGEYLGPDLSTFIKDADDAFSGYIRGQFVDALIIGVITALVFTLLSVPYGPIIGLLTGFGNLIPYVGAPVGYVTTVIVCLAVGDFSRMLAGVIALSIIMFLDANVLNPRLLSNAVEVHPLVVVVALIAGSAVGGLAGMLIAVPSAAFIKVQLERWLIRREEALEASGKLFSYDDLSYTQMSADQDLDEPGVPVERVVEETPTEATQKVRQELDSLPTLEEGDDLR